MLQEVTPHVIFTFWGIQVTSTVISTWIMMAIVIGAAAIFRRKRPAILELVFDALNDLISDILGRPAEYILPFLGSLAIFLLMANLIGIIPGLASPTGDINTPIALAVIVFFSVHVFGSIEKGFLKYLKELTSPIYLFPFELISQFSRTISLTLRLFGNIISSEFIVAVIFTILPFIVPLPLIALHIFDGLLQAYIFTALSTVYIAGAILANEPVGARHKQLTNIKSRKKGK